MESQNKEQLVSLKVMRLLRPTLYSALPCFTEPEHGSENFSKHLLESAFNRPQYDGLSADPNFALTDFLVIPQIFGNLYIGETFTSYICLHNHSSSKVTQLSIKVELQTTSQKIALPFKSNIDYVEEFGADEKFDGIVEYDVKELGNHILICVVNYTSDKNERMSFKKFYKFMVSKPFEIQPRFPLIESQNKLMKNSLLFQAQIQNITSNTVYMEDVQLQPLKDTVTVENIHSAIATSENFSIMKPSEVKQYLFKVTFHNIDKEPKPLVVGKLDISWRNSFGEFGHLQTHPLSQPQDIYNLSQSEIKLKVVGDLNELVIDETADVECHIVNTSERELDLGLKLENDTKSGFVWNCPLNYQIGKVGPKNKHVLKLSIVPFQLGLISLTGITITDLFLKRVYEFSNLINVFVLDDQKNPPKLSQLVEG